MKQLLIIYVATLLSSSSDARSLSSKPTQVFTKQQTLSSVKPVLQNSDMVFTNLPEGTLEADIVDANGRTTRTMAISRANNRINTASLTSGVYAIVLRTGSETRMFGYCSGITVKANKL